MRQSSVQNPTLVGKSEVALCFILFLYANRCEKDIQDKLSGDLKALPLAVMVSAQPTWLCLQREHTTERRKASKVRGLCMTFYNAGSSMRRVSSDAQTEGVHSYITEPQMGIRDRDRRTRPTTHVNRTHENALEVPGGRRRVKNG